MNINWKSHIQWSFIVVCTMMISACQNVIQVDLNNVAPQTVIEGSISNINETVKVTLSETTDYFSPGNIKPIDSAQVSISDNNGNLFQPVAAANGVYNFGKLNGTTGNTYTLKVQISKGTYEASSTML